MHGDAQSELSPFFTSQRRMVQNKASSGRLDTGTSHLWGAPQTVIQSNFSSSRVSCIFFYKFLFLYISLKGLRCDLSP